VSGPGEEGRGGIRGLVRDVLRLDRRALVILVTVPVVLTVMEYYGLPWHYTRQLERAGRSLGRTMSPTEARDPPFSTWIGNVDLPGPDRLRPYVWWGIACLVLFVVVPMLAGRLLAKTSPRETGLRLRGTGKDAWTYAILYALFLPIIWLVSLRADFRETYPFYRPLGAGLGVDFVAFEAIYCFQFFAVEYFFRGFIVLGLKPVLGWASVLVMLAPYCMIHYYKPFPEAMGAIGAGLVLGTLAWRTGTVIYGWFLHYAVALSMDLLALHGTGRL
jgi:hypothetical protein